MVIGIVVFVPSTGQDGSSVACPSKGEGKVFERERSHSSKGKG